MLILVSTNRFRPRIRDGEKPIPSFGWPGLNA
jgi:hypothetical protein